jgi:hypothetical protein
VVAGEAVQHPVRRLLGLQELRVRSFVKFLCCKELQADVVAEAEHSEVDQVAPLAGLRR